MYGLLIHCRGRAVIAATGRYGPAEARALGLLKTVLQWEQRDMSLVW